MLVKQRDNEIGILLNYLNKQKDAQGRGEEFNTGVPVESFSHAKQSTDVSQQDSSTKSEKEESKSGTLYQMMGGKPSTLGKSIAEKRMDFELNQQTAQTKQSSTGGFEKELKEAQAMLDTPVNCTLEDLADRAKSFELFRKSYRKNEAMEENRELLKEKYGRGKQLGVSVNNNRQLIKDLTNKIEQIRKQNALRGMVDESGELIKTEEED